MPIRFKSRQLLEAFLTAAIFAITLHSQAPDLRTDLEQGIRSYESGDFPEAVKHLERAVSLDPNSATAHFYLALAYHSMCPETNPQANPRWTSAIQEYKRVLEIDPSHKEALKSMAYLLYSIARLDEAEVLYRRAVQIDGADPEALYSVAVTMFQRTYAVLMEEKSRHHLERKQSLIHLSECRPLRYKYLAEIDEGISLLTKAAGLSNSVDVQGYLATYYAERAELQCGDRPLYKRDLLAAERLWNQACLTSHVPRTGALMKIPGLPPPPPKRGDSCRW